LVFDGASGAEVAAELGMTRAAVYMAQSRVLKRLREEAAGLLE
jgi:biotin operon repressor